MHRPYSIWACRGFPYGYLGNRACIDEFLGCFNSFTILFLGSLLAIRVSLVDESMEVLIHD